MIIFLQVFKQWESGSGYSFFSCSEVKLQKASSYHSIVFVILIFDSFLKSNDVQDIRLEKVELSVGGFEFMHDS